MYSIGSNFFFFFEVTWDIAFIPYANTTSPLYSMRLQDNSNKQILLMGLDIVS